MKIFKRILIVIGIILYANYIIHLPMCVNDYANKDFGIYSTQTMHKHSTLTMSTVLKLVSESTLKFYILPRKADFIFDYTNNFYAIINIPVYLWQFARANINPCVLFHWTYGKYDKNKCSNHISHCPDIYCSKVSIGRVTMDYKKEIIQLIENCNDIHWLKTIYAYIKRLIG